MTECVCPTLTQINPITGDNMGPGFEFVLPPYSSGYSPLSNQIYIFPFTLAANTRVVFNTMHTDCERQDYTLYSWFSIQPVVPVMFYENRTYEISLVRGSRPFGMQDVNYTGTNIPSPRISMMYAQPGNYYFQIGNRTNYTNKFEFIQTIDTLT